LRVSLRLALFAVLALLASALLINSCSAVPEKGNEMTHRWLFVWRSVHNPAEVDRMIARFPRAQAAGYNACVFPFDVASSKAQELKAAATRYGLDLIPVVMSGSRDQNYTEGVPSRDALFVAKGGVLVFQPDNPTRIANGDFERVTGDDFEGWHMQAEDGTPLVADHKAVHGGKTSVYVEPNGSRCVLTQSVRLQPFRQYRASIWAKSEGLRAHREGVGIGIVDAKTKRRITYQNTGVKPDEEWTLHTISFNSLESTEASFSVGVQWGDEGGRLWLDDFTVEEMGLVNVVRRPGCPVTVRGEDGTEYEEGRDYEPIVDPHLQITEAYHEPPVVRLTPGTRMKEGERLRISYYHPVVIYDFKTTSCLSEPKRFQEWQAQIKQVNDLLHPAAFFMDFDEIRVANWCALCQSRHLTPGELFADATRRAVKIIRDLRPDAPIWVWSDMYDPMVNGVDDYYFCNGPMTGAWKGLEPRIGIINWAGELLGANSPFFADRGHKQILSGYYDGDEDGTTITQWIDKTKGVPGVVGAMYTTWQDKYDAMDVWAKKAWGGKAK